MVKNVDLCVMGVCMFLLPWSYNPYLVAYLW
jgi:hypothetical protein